MAKTKSALKAWRQSLRRRLRNRSQQSAVKTYIRKAETAIVAGQLEAAAVVVRTAVRALDKAAEKGIIHGNNAARRKSRLVKKYNVAQAQALAATQAAVAKEARPRRRRVRRSET